MLFTSAAEPEHNRRTVLKSGFNVKERILKRFSEEIATLERELKFELPKEIKRARELGDLRENAEYKAAKERQEIINARIAMLKKRVAEVSLMNLDRIPRGRAGFGSTVHVRDRSGEVLVYQLVMPEEADAEKGMISTSSPIGRGILNKEEGDEITVMTPSGTRQFELVKLITIHDD
jgi:transcription elongation factor GreA